MKAAADPEVVALAVLPFRLTCFDCFLACGEHTVPPFGRFVFGPAPAIGLLALFFRYVAHCPSNPIFPE